MDESKLGHSTRTSIALDKPWEYGVLIERRCNQYTARGAVINVLERQSKKCIACAVDILNHAVKWLKKTCSQAKLRFNELSIISERKSKELKLFKAMIGQARDCIKGMKCRFNKDKMQLLTDIVALFILPKSNSMFKSLYKLLLLNP